MSLCVRWISWLVVPTFCSCSAFDEPPCTGFEDATSDGRIVIRALNQTSLPLYFVASSTLLAAESFTLERRGEPLPWVELPCDSCEAMKDGFGCALIPGIPSMVEVPAGGHHDFEWDGLIRRERRMPSGCAPFSFDDGLCTQMVLAPEDSYVVTLSGFAQHSCEGCTCSTGFADGSCLVENATPTEPYATQRTEIVRPSPRSHHIELVFD